MLASCAERLSLAYTVFAICVQHMRRLRRHVLDYFKRDAGLTGLMLEAQVAVACIYIAAYVCFLRSASPTSH